MEHVIKTQGLTKRYGKNIVVNNLNIHLHRGEIYGFIGKNGAGKTTCMKMLCGLLTPSEGEVTLFNENNKESVLAYSRIGCLIEAPGLYPNLSAYQNLKLKCICMGIKKENYIEEILELVGLGDTGKKKTKKFSLGMKQRLGIAMALVGEPDILILDEPMNGLDPQGIVEVRDTILKLNRKRNMTIMISSHILDELSKIVDRYGIIHNGVLVEELTKEELANKSRDYIEIITDEPNKACVQLDLMNIEQYKVINSHTVYVYEKLEEISAINKQLVLAECKVTSIRIISEGLEDYFLSLTGGMLHD